MKLADRKPHPSASPASRLNHRIRQRGVERGKDSIYAVVLDGDTAHCLTESHLDTWWNSQTPEQKAEIYERDLGDGEERCRFCGCTNGRACIIPSPHGAVPCSWLDWGHTVCSAPACATRYNAEMFDEVFGYADHSGGTVTVKAKTDSELLENLDAWVDALRRAPGTFHSGGNLPSERDRRNLLLYMDVERLAKARLSPFGRERVDQFLRTGQWLWLGELDQAKSWEKEAHDATL